MLWIRETHADAVLFKIRVTVSILTWECHERCGIPMRHLHAGWLRHIGGGSSTYIIERSRLGEIENTSWKLGVKGGEQLAPPSLLILSADLSIQGLPASKSASISRTKWLAVHTDTLHGLLSGDRPSEEWNITQTHLRDSPLLSHWL